MPQPQAQRTMPEYYHPGLRILLFRRRVTADWCGRRDSFSEPFWRMYWNAEPGVSIEYGSRKFPLGPDHVVLIPPETPYFVHARRPFDQFYVHFVASLPFDACQPGIYRFDAEPWVLERIRLMSGAGIEEPNLDRNLSLMAQTICLDLLRRMPASALRQDVPGDKIASVLSHIDRCVPASVTNEQLANMAGMSANAFIRLFRQKLGLTPQQYILNRKIQNACTLLRFSGMTIESVADACGFTDRYHFTKVFSKRKKMGPAEFRKQGVL